MFKLLACIQKEVRLLMRDKVGLLLMFVMPVLLAVLIAAIQNSTFKLVNENKIRLILYNADRKPASLQLQAALESTGMFEISKDSAAGDEKAIAAAMKKKDALVAITIPQDFSGSTESRSRTMGSKIFSDLGFGKDTLPAQAAPAGPIRIIYDPVLQESFRQSVNGAVKASLQLIENKQLIKTMYALVDEKKIPSQLEDELLKSQVPVTELTAAHNGGRVIPNATQHNIPAWTVFAMFFIVTSLGSNVVREKNNGSFIRLKTLPASYLLSLIAKQITFLTVTLAQVLVIFAIGVYCFPLMGLPELNMPSDLSGLLLVSLICGWCAVSYAICVGVFANTQEQANGFGAVTIVILAAIGGLLVPSFVMPDALRLVMNLSPLHWCLESFYGLFLKGGTLNDIILNIIPLLLITFLLQGISLWGLKRKNLI